MSRRDFVLLVCAFSLLLVVARSSAIDFTRTEIPGTGVTLNLPTDWVPIPSEVIQRYTDDAARSSANPPEIRATANYVYGAQRKAENYFEYPYLLVQILNTGRISEAQLDAFRKALATGEKEAEGSFPNIFQGSKFAPIYDPTTKRFWAEFSGTVAGLGSMHSLSTIILTETGFVTINMYCKEGDFTSLAPLFREIGTNVELSSSIAYEPRSTDDPTITSIVNAAQGINWSKVITYAVIGVIVAWIGNVIRGKKGPK